MARAYPFHSDTPISGLSAQDLIVQARIQLMLTKKFFGRLCMRLALIPTESRPTAAVDVRGRLYYNPKLLNFCDLSDAIWVVAHEVMHLVQRYHDRYPFGADNDLWNIAADIVVNQALDECGIRPSKRLLDALMPPGLLPEHQKYKGWFTERIYYDLLKEKKNQAPCEACRKEAEDTLKQHQERSKDSQGDGDEQQQGQGQQEKQGGGSGGQQQDDGSGDSQSSGSGQGGDKCGDGCGSGCGDEEADDGPPHTCRRGGPCCSGVLSDESNATEVGDAADFAKWKRQVINAAEGVGRGDLPGSVQRILEDLGKPSVSWKDRIRQMGSNVFGKGRYTFKRPGRRTRSLGLRTPSRLPDPVGALVWLDSSMSISHTVLTQFATECMGILEQTGADFILVGGHHVTVYELREVHGKLDLLEFPFQGGGTSHMDVFNISDGNVGAEGIELPKNYKVGMIVCLTDMESQFPEVCKIPTLFGVPSQCYNAESPWYTKPSFGQVVEVTIHG